MLNGGVARIRRDEETDQKKKISQGGKWERDNETASAIGAEFCAREREGDSERDGMVVSVTARSSARTVFERVLVSSSSRVQSTINSLV